jgi:hypothetical protein
MREPAHGGADAAARTGDDGVVVRKEWSVTQLL